MKSNNSLSENLRKITHGALREDPRIDPRISEILAMAPDAVVVPPRLDADYEQTLNYIGEAETFDREQQKMMALMLPKVDSVGVREETITGQDGNAIKLYIHQPLDQTGELPAIVHLHGGGMAMMSAADPGYQFLRSTMALTGMVVIGVEFRNSAGGLGAFPFPAGLNDCESAVHWAHSNRRKMGLSSVIVCGESGGGNLSLATVLKANREGWASEIDGVYVSCPFISGSYANPPAELGSLNECEGYMLNQYMANAMVKAYDPLQQFNSESLAWPLKAKQAELSGLPPHRISVNELDPLRDEGLAYAEKLAKAEVRVSTRIVKGTPHAGELLFSQVVPNLFADTIESIYDFASRSVPVSCEA